MVVSHARLKDSSAILWLDTAGSGGLSQSRLRDDGLPEAPSMPSGQRHADLEFFMRVRSQLGPRWTGNRTETKGASAVVILRPEA